MEDEELKPRLCSECTKEKCDDPHACLRQWLAKRYPGENIMPSWLCKIDEEVR